MADIFLSYNREDQAAARRFAEAFEAQGFGVWWDVTLRSGEAYDEVTENALKTAKAVVVLWSPRSVVSRWVRAEATLAERNKTLIPATIEPCDRPIMFELTQTAELSHWQGEPADKTWLAFLADVKRFVDRGADKPKSAPASIAAPARAVSEDSGRSICVLPFVNMSGDPEQDYFSDGLSEELLNQLAQLKGLKVAARTSCFAFKGQNPDLKLVSEKLGVAHVLEGSVRKSGNRLRITAQLIKAADGFHLWSETFNRELDDVFAIQEDIARAVAAALKITLGMGETTLRPGGTHNVEAYDLYLAAKSAARQMAPAELKRGAQLYRRALALDPGFAAAWTGLAQTMYFSRLYIPERRGEFDDVFDEAIIRAQAIAPDFWETHSACCLRSLNQYDWGAAEEALAKMKAFAPANEPNPDFCATSLHAFAGRAQTAVMFAMSARRIDPLAITMSYFLQVSLMTAGRWDEAGAEYARSLDLTGDREALEHTEMWRLLALGDVPAFKDQMRRFLACESIQLSVLREVRGLLDQPEAARAKLRDALDDPASQDPTRQFKLAKWAALFGDVDLALAAARRAYVDGKSITLNLIWLPVMRDVRQDPRFKDLLRDVGLVDYWRSSGDWGDFARPVGDDDFEIIA